MVKRMIGVWLLLLAVVGWLPASVHAQDANWQAQLYEPTTGTLTTIDSSGQVADSFTLPLAAGFDHFPARVAVGHGGSPLAYVAYNSVTFQGMLIVSQRDRLIARFTLPLTTTTSFEYIADDSAFNDDNTRVALGYSLEGGGWGIVVLNLLTGAVDYNLTSDLPAVTTAGIPTSAGLTPVIRRFSLQTVTFNLVLGGAASAGEFKAYDWTVDSNALTQNPIFTSLDSDRHAATDELVMTTADNRLANQAASFPFFQANSLQVYETLTGARFPFFNLADATLQTPRFIQNGERVLVDTATADGRYAWTVIERSGAVVGTLPTVMTLNEVEGVGDGFVYTTDTFSPGARTLVYVDTRGGLNAGVPIWTSGAGELPLLVWAGSTSISVQSISTTYTAWSQLAAPVYAPGSTPIIAPAPDQPLLVSPSDIATPEATRRLNAILAPGGLAVIHTTDGSQLNVRSGAGTGYLIVAKLGEGAQVTVTDGPIAADGFTWWQIRTESGIAGWVVESVTDGAQRLQTLLPI
ncbi:MAG: SH3 domain-containing protein [Chloroflexi bacterium]|nr:SH3 domain-containing protein [Chloroflexota bacterium]MCC6894260.1 SH3 domain-containing protein [Anaerolineae bacterium]